MFRLPILHFTQSNEIKWLLMCPKIGLVSEHFIFYHPLYKILFRFSLVHWFCDKQTMKFLSLFLVFVGIGYMIQLFMVSKYSHHFNSSAKTSFCPFIILHYSQQPDLDCLSHTYLLHFMNDVSYFNRLWLHKLFHYICSNMNDMKSIVDWP